MSDLVELQKRALEIKDKYSELNVAKGQAAWGLRDITLGFIVDVGELSEYVMAKENLRYVDDVDAKLSHELSDCLWSVLVIAGKLGIDLEAEFKKTMQQLETKIAGEMK
jgi:NTP pyrophosphatase (non-canonical NTP hydrolase)